MPCPAMLRLMVFLSRCSPADTVLTPGQRISYGIGGAVFSVKEAAYAVKPDPGRSILEYLPTRWADALLKKVLTPK